MNNDVCTSVSTRETVPTRPATETVPTRPNSKTQEKQTQPSIQQTERPLGYWYVPEMTVSAATTDFMDWGRGRG